MIFQPHQRSRTEAFFSDFAASLAGVDRVVITDVFSAREGSGPDDKALAERLAQAVRELNTDASHLSLEVVQSRLESIAEAGDVLLVVGAGDINRVSDHIFRS